MIRRRSGVTSAVVASAMLLAGCGGEGTTGAAPTPAPPSPTAATGCHDPIEPPLQDGSHLIGDAAPPVQYSSTPPTSGWHASGTPRTGVIPPDDPLTDPELVLAIEVGQVVAAYDPDRLPADAIERLEELASDTYRDRLTVTPYTGAERRLTLVAWGVLQPCAALDVAALDAFVAEHAEPDTDAH